MLALQVSCQYIAMLTQQKSMVALAVVLLTASASASPLVYVLTGNQQFGALDLATGKFRQIGPDLPDGTNGLAAAPNGSLLTLAFTGNLDSINPVTGVETIGPPTGLSDCSNYPVSPCGPKSANAIATLGGTVYATDYQNNLYTINPLTGHATLIGPTGVPPLTFVPLSTPNPDGTLNFYSEALFGAGGKLYATFSTGATNFTDVTRMVMPDHLYQIDPATGRTTLIAPTAFGLDTGIDVNGTTYAFEGDTRQVVTLNLANGATNFVSNIDAAAGLVFGASPVPEPASIALAGIGIVALLLLRWKKRVTPSA